VLGESTVVLSERGRIVYQNEVMMYPLNLGRDENSSALTSSLPCQLSGCYWRVLRWFTRSEAHLEIAAVVLRKNEKADAKQCGPMISGNTMYSTVHAIQHPLEKLCSLSTCTFASCYSKPLKILPVRPEGRGKEAAARHTLYKLL